MLQPNPTFAQSSSFCAEVKLEISQKATLEREAFDAHLIVNNDTEQPLTDFRVQIFFKDSAGNSASQYFFVKPSTVTGTNAVDGTGVIQSSSTADIHWLIIPATGAGGDDPIGKQYAVSALITGNSNGAPQSLTTFDASISVHPQPLIKLEYALPYEVFADEPLTATIEPVEPFPLAVRVTNVGYGTANNFQIQSAQPKIVENKQGLQINFSLIGTQVNGQTIPDTLNIAFGTIPPQGVSQGSWVMATTLSGRFISFTSTFSHAAELGGQLTSLMQSVTTYTLLKDVLVALPGRDQNPDYLVNISQDRETMQDMLNLGIQPPAEFILESDQPQPLPVAEVAGSLSGELAGTNASLTFALTGAVSPNVWAHSYAVFPYGRNAKLVSARRGDGKPIDLRNVWISKHFRKSDNSTVYWINILDLTGSDNTYTVQFDPTGFDLPPGAIADLAAVTSSGGGSLALSWSSPGEDGYTGNLFGGHIYVAPELSSAAVFSPSASQVSFTTSAAPGSAQAFQISNLVGNATYYIALFAQDMGGGMSSLSNLATAYTLPNPPTGLTFPTVSTGSLIASWQIGNNSLPIEYQVRLTTEPGGQAIASSPYYDSFSGSHAFAGLMPNTSYYLTGLSHNPETLVASPISASTVAVTLAETPLAQPAVPVSSESATVNWSVISSPEDTEYYAELSTASDHQPIYLASGWVQGAGYTFSGLTPNVVYYAQVKARNRAYVETAYADLGTLSTSADDILPPRTSLAYTAPSYSSGTLFATDLTTFRLDAADDLASVGDGTGAGVAQTYIAVDTDTFSLYGGTFTLAQEGLHHISFYSVDLASHTESTQTATIGVDLTAPLTHLEPFAAIVASGTALSLVSEDPVSSGTASGLASVSYVVDTDPFSPDCLAVPASTEAPHGTCANPAYADPFTLEPGTHTVYYYAKDNLGNQEELRIASVTVDALPPMTALAVSPPNFSSGAYQYASGLSTFSLLAQDDAAAENDGLGTVGQTYLAVDTTTYLLYSGTFSLAGEGLHELAYYSTDLAGHAESTKTATYALDLTPPSSLLQVQGPSSQDEEGRIVITTHTPLALEAADPDLAGSTVPGSGLQALSYVVDADPFSAECLAVPASTEAPHGTCANQAYDGAFTLSEGTHTVYYFSQDNLGNQEAVKLSSFSIDALPPTTTFVVGEPSYQSDRLYATAVTTFGLVAADDLSGVAQTYIALDTTTFSVYSGTFSLSGEGRHELSFYSVDLLGHAETPISRPLALDTSPPATELVFSTPAYVNASSQTFIALENQLGLSSQDAGSGAALTEYRVDGGTFAAFASSFTLPGGSHIVEWRGQDNVGNQEELRNLSVAVDSQVPATTLLINGLPASTTDLVLVSTDVLALLAMEDGSGLRQTMLSLDGGEEQVYSSTFSLSVGTHTLAWRSADNVGNQEALLSASASVREPDYFAPELALTPGDGSTLTVTTPAIAAVYSDTGTGVDLASVRLSLDGLDVTSQAVVTASSVSFTPAALAQGTYTITASVSDNSGNTAGRTAGFYIDSIAPATVLLVNGQPAGAQPVAVSTDAFGFSAADSGTGVQATRYSLDGGPEQDFVSAFLLAQGAHSVAFFSLDKAGNQEAVRVASVTVLSTGAVPAGYAMLSGSISFSEGFPAGSTVTLVVSTDGFSNQPMAYPLLVSGGSSLPYSLTLPAPAGVQLAAFLGTDLGQISPATALGFYNHFAVVALTDGGSVAGLDFSIAPDTAPPSVAVGTPVDGSTIAVLGTISGTAADEVAATGSVDLAVHDPASDLWWDSQARQWVSSGPVYGRYGHAPLAESVAWSVETSTESAESLGLAGYLTPGRSYTLYARAVDLVGNVTAQPAAVTFSWSGPSGQAPPPAPAWITAQALSTITIQFNWALVEGATGYTVYRSTIGPKVASVTSNYIVQGTTVPNTARTRCVAAANAYGESPMVCYGPVYTMAAVPSGLQAVAASSDSITWAWNASGNPPWTYYSISLSTDAFTTNFSTPIPFSMLYTATSAVVAGLAPDTLYYGHVRAANMDMLRTPFSSAVSTRTPAEPGLPPAAPAWISGEVLGVSSVAWTWALVEGATGYTLYESTAGPSLGSVAVASFTMAGLPPNSPHALCAAAANAYGEGPMACHQALYTRAAVPGQPWAVSAGTDSITWVWDASGNADGTYYELALSSDGFASAWAAVPIENLYASTTAVVSGLQAGTQYWAMVRAANHSMSLSPFSSIGSTSTAAPSPDIYSPLAVILSPQTGITIPPPLFTLSGTAADNVGVTGVSLAIQDLTSFGWWDPSAAAFVAGPGPLWSVPASLSDLAAGSVSWSADSSAIAAALVSGRLYTVWAQARDAAGNVHQATATVSIDERANGLTSGGANAIAIDPSGNIWEVFTSSGPTPETSPQTMVKYDSSGRFLASTALTGAFDLGTWSIKFGPDGYAYAVGGAADAVTGQWNLAVYVVRPDGASLEAVRTLADTQGRSSLAFDSAGNVWITGTLLNDWQIEGTAMALWKYDPYLDELNLATTAVVGLGSIGMGVDLDADDNIWVVGLSSIPTTSGTDRLALTLLKFDPTGSQVLAGPFLREGFLKDPGDTYARVLVQGSDLFIAATKANASGNLDLAFLKYDLAGNPAFAKVWTGAAGKDDVPSRLAALSDGLIIGGSFNEVGAPSSAAAAAVWKFSTTGQLLFAQTITGFGKIHDLAVAGSNIWLAASSPYATPGPYLFTGGTDVAGTLGSLDGQPPAAPAWVSGVALSTLAIQFNWALVDGATGYTVYRSTSGPKVASVTSNYFVQGTTTPNTARSRCVAAANEYGESPMTCSGPVFTLAEIPSQFQAVETSSHSITWSWNASGNPAGTEYALSLSTDAFTTHFSTPIPFSMHYTGISATVYGLAQDTLYYGHVRATNFDGRRTPFSATVSTRTLAESPAVAMSPSTGPIGIPFTIAGSGFGTYDGANTRVRFGPDGPLAPLSLWNDTTITGTIPGLAPGAYAVSVERQAGAELTVVSAGGFEVLVPQVSTYTPVSAPIGTPFTITGSAFGPYAGTLTRVLIGGFPAPLTVWNDTAISGTIPGISSGTQYLIVERTTSDGGLVHSATAYLTVTVPEVSTLSPSTGPIGLPFTITGASFGPYNGSYTRVTFGGVPAPLTLWTDTQIQGTIPGIGAGDQPVIVERTTADGGLAQSATAYFQVRVPAIASVVPSSGPIGITLTVTGTSFGNYTGTNMRLMVGGVSAPLSLWTDEQIVATVPGEAPEGQVPVVVERATADGGLVQSATAYFEVTAPQTASITPSSGPIGVPFTITGTSFGAYNGSNTRIRFGDLLAPLTVWNDTTISGTVPGVLPGSYSVLIEIQQGSEVSVSTAGTFTVSLPALSVMTPGAGPIGVPFTITGTSFGPYNGSYTRVKIGGAAAPLTLWTDTQIQGAIPGVLPGSLPVVIERATTDGGLAQSATFFFEVMVPSVTSISPVSGPIGTAFTLTGTNFGPYNGSYTRVKVAGFAAALSLWNDTTITGAIPGDVASGLQPMVVERATADSGLVQGATVYFDVTGPMIGTLNPSTGPIGIPFTITGSNFGVYNGANTRVKFGTVAAPLSVWTDTSISGTVPGVSSGTYEVVVERQEGSSVSRSMAASFTAALPQAQSLVPVSGPIGVPFTITGTGFGPYDGANTRVKIGGLAAPLSVWNDTTISGTLPGASAGAQELLIERATADGGLMQQATSFLVTLPQIASLTPSSAPIGAPFTITGASFGPYAGSLTQVLIGGVSAPLTVWNDTTISGSVPGSVAAGSTTVVVRRTTADSGLAEASTDFLVVTPQITALVPTSGQSGDAFELQGAGFGPYLGSASQVRFGDAPASLSYWTDTIIRGTVPEGLSVGTYTVVVMLSPSGGSVQSNPANYGVGTEGLGVLGFGAMAARQAPRPSWYYEASLALRAEEGGKVASASHASVVVPPLALATTTTLTIDRGAVEGQESESRTRTMSAVSLAAAGEPIKFGPDGTRFAVPVTIELPYDPAAVLFGQESKIAVHYWDPVAKTWTALPSEIDAARRCVRARTDHFSLYQPLVPGSASPAAVGAFAYVDLYAFPNPARGRNPTIRVQVGQADSVDINIYDVSGRLVKSATVTGGQNLDDGNGKGLQWTYDYDWDVSGVGSGVYLYVVTAKRAGYSPIRKTGKLGVIR
jgi:hypothetical protein